LRLQPVPGGELGGRFGHPANDVAEDGRPHRVVAPPCRPASG
jgi:hypothetical protein